MNIKECFEILELRVDASLDQVKKAYKTLMMVFHPDKVQGNPKLKMIAEKKAKEINMAREELIAYLNDRKRIGKQKKIMIPGGERHGKASDFINEECRLDNSIGSYHLDVYIAYRHWCNGKGFRAVSIEDLEQELYALNIVGSRQNLYGIDSIHWQDIEISDYYSFITDPDDYTYPYDSDNDPDYVELKEYSDMDNDDDLGEVVF